MHVSLVPIFSTYLVEVVVIYIVRREQKNMLDCVRVEYWLTCVTVVAL